MGYIDTIISKVRRDLSKYSDAGLLDDNEMYSDIISELRRFGNDICVAQETFIQVDKGYAILPDNFFALKLALWCEPDYYKATNIETNTLLSSVIYRERVEISNQWNECDSCNFNQTDKIVRENIYFSPDSYLTFAYKNPIPLRLARGIEKSVCAKNCLNLHRNNDLFEINIIKRKTVQANFKEGTIYIQYLGFPLDEEGNIDVPEFPNGHLDKYLEYYLKRRVAESLIANNDAQGLQNLYPTYAQQEMVALRNATNEVKLTNFSTQEFRRKMRAFNKYHTLQQEVFIPNLW